MPVRVLSGTLVRSCFIVVTEVLSLIVAPVLRKVLPLFRLVPQFTMLEDLLEGPLDVLLRNLRVRAHINQNVIARGRGSDVSPMEMNIGGTRSMQAVGILVGGRVPFLLVLPSVLP